MGSSTKRKLTFNYIVSFSAFFALIENFDVDCWFRNISSYILHIWGLHSYSDKYTSGPQNMEGYTIIIPEDMIRSGKL